MNLLEPCRIGQFPSLEYGYGLDWRRRFACEPATALIRSQILIEAGSLRRLPPVSGTIAGSAVGASQGAGGTSSA